MDHEIETFDPSIHLEADNYNLTIKPSQAIELRATLNSALDELAELESGSGIEEEDQSAKDAVSEPSLEEQVKKAINERWEIKTTYTDPAFGEDRVIIVKKLSQTLLSRGLGEQLKTHDLTVRAAGKSDDNQPKLSIGWRDEL